jgi:hypothetical protein
VSTIAEKGAKPLGPIEDSVTYPLPLFMQLSGLSDWGMRMARRAGLKVHKCGRRHYVRGVDWSTYLSAQDDQG